MPDRYLIAGCAGFIGARVAHLLLESGHEVVGIDNFTDLYDVRLKRWRVEQLLLRPGFTFQRVGIEDQAAVERLFRDLAVGGRLDAIINLAACTGVRQSVRDPWIYYASNVTGTLNLLEAARQHGIEKFILPSTSSLYGDNNRLPYREDAGTDRPLSPYAASKKAAETLCYSYHHLHGLDITVFRFFTVYGPAGRPDMSPFRFVKWISEGTPVTVYGDGTQVRDFTFVDDIADGVIRGLRPLKYEIINLGCGSPVVLLDAIRLIEQAVGRRAELEFEPRNTADMDATWADIAKAERLLGWKPRTRFEQGIVQVVRWYQDNRNWAQEIQT